MTSLKRFLSLVLVVLMLSTSIAIAQEGDPIVIGTSLPLTGMFSIPGSKHQEGYELCVNQINEQGGLLGRPVQLIVQDNRSDTEQAISQYERLINVDNVDLIFGTFSSKLTFPASAIAEQNGMVFPIPAGGALRIYEQGFENMFYFQQNAGEFIGTAPLAALNDLVGKDSPDYPKTAVVVHADDLFANATADGLLGHQVMGPDGELIVDLAPGLLSDAGIEAVSEEVYPGEGFNDWLGLANSIRQSEADMLIGLTASPEEVINLTQALQTVGYQPSVVFYSQGTQAEFYDAVGDATNGVMVHSSWHPLADYVGMLGDQPFSNSDFIKLYEDTYDAEADEDVAIPFSLCMGISQAVEAVGSTDNAEIRDWLKARTAEDPVKTILGSFHWDEKGLPIDRAFLMLQWQDGNLNLIYPVGEFEGTFDIINPKPEW
jgi:branched-chain amino acid transport system substrate-binding protein